ncbi:response regulator transcription factor [Clostridioides difficile]|uniref:LytR/AlgR family response regulator transcription factor n=1 Tax=unclassified Clostridioides TaxID=2635829 RepID=UPI001697D81F|nr:response regulator transcription factor [Clostridioides difficile]
MNIFIFDTESNFSMKLKDIIGNILMKKCWDNYNVDILENLEDVLAQTNDIDKAKIFFLGVNHDSHNGLHIAKKIREIDYHSTIIFLTSFPELCMSVFTYRIEAMDFILKDDLNIIKSRVEACLETINKRHNKNGLIKNGKFLSFYSDHTFWKIKFDDIIYFETSPTPHKIKVVTNNNTIEFYSSLKNISKLDKCFLRTHQSFVVNSDHIFSLNLKEKKINMDNGSVCFISSLYLNDVNKLKSTQVFG